MFVEWRIFGIATVVAALSMVATVGAQEVPSPYGAAAPGGAGTQEPAAEMPAETAGSGMPEASAPAAEPVAASADAYGAPAEAADLGTDPSAAATERKSPNPSWLAEQNRASAKLREEQLAKMNGAGEAAPAE